MSQGATSTAPDTAAARAKPRARSLPSSRTFTVAAIFSAFFYVGVITTVTSLVLFFISPSQIAVKIIMASMMFSLLAWLLAFFRRRSAHCPLCKGTPLVNTGALAHSRATRLFPFNHGTTATMSIIATQTFRCMYCGSDFDLLKTPSHLRGKDDYVE